MSRKNKKKEKKYPHTSLMFVIGMIFMFTSVYILIGSNIRMPLRLDISVGGIFTACILAIPAFYNMIIKMDEDGDGDYDMYLGKFIVLSIFPIMCFIYFIMRLIGVLSGE